MKIKSLKTLTLKLFTIWSLICLSSTAWAKNRLVDIERSYSVSDPLTKIAPTPQGQITELIKFLTRSSHGRKLVEQAKLRAREENRDFETIIELSEGSFTDTTLIRRFSPHNPEEMTFQSQSTVFINRDLRFMDALLDLAHELTHYTLRDSFNPYDRSFNLKHFVATTVEGKGGEVEAYMTECEVLMDLFPSQLYARSNCHKILDESEKKFSRKKAVEQFYQVGSHWNPFINKVELLGFKQKDFPFIGKQESLFISSAYGLPYPLAAVEEFQAIMQKVCENDRQRLKIYQQRWSSAQKANPENKNSRLPASRQPSNSLQLERQMKSMAQNFEHRCQKFN